MNQYMIDTMKEARDILLAIPQNPRALNVATRLNEYVHTVEEAVHNAVQEISAQMSSYVGAEADYDWAHK